MSFLPPRTLQPPQQTVSLLHGDDGSSISGAMAAAAAAVAAAVRCHLAGRAQSHHGAKTHPAFAWSFLLLGDAEPAGERGTRRAGRTAGTSAPHLHPVLRLAPAALRRKSPFTSTRTKASPPDFGRLGRHVSAAASPRGSSPSTLLVLQA